MSGAHLPDGLEVRSAPMEVRALSNSRRLEGHAALWNVEARIGGGIGGPAGRGRGAGFREVITRNAFQDSLRSGRDTVALWDHNPTYLLGRVRAGSLLLQEDERGLAFALDVAETSYGNDLLSLVRSGLAGGMSFGFTLNEGGERWAGDLRELRSVALREVSVISWQAAYEGTTVNARSMQHAEAAASVALRRRRLELI